MSRLIASDFEEFSIYLSKYSLEGTNAGGNKELKKGHRIYYGALSAWSSIEHGLRKRSRRFGSKSMTIDSSLLPYFRESISDIGSGLFCCVHGAYKPAHVSLRSGIENYIRFCAGIFDDEAITTTSVFRLFEVAKKTEAFSGDRSEYYSVLKSTYGELCKYTHSASADYMVGVNALSHFPAIDKKQFCSWNSHAELVSRAIFDSAFLLSPALYNESHYKVKEVLDGLISKSARLKMLNPAG